mmetsp:Transcript_22791/g.71375  ORF Transcript_22791/g.71375 Transcript_22791/m.71375 type:complete len:220 (-) Transcript_22791:241-900(-)
MRSPSTRPCRRPWGSAPWTPCRKTWAPCGTTACTRGFPSSATRSPRAAELCPTRYGCGAAGSPSLSSTTCPSCPCRCTTASSTTPTRTCLAWSAAKCPSSPPCACFARAWCARVVHAAARPATTSVRGTRWSAVVACAHSWCLSGARPCSAVGAATPGGDPSTSMHTARRTPASCADALSSSTGSVWSPSWRSGTPMECESMSCTTHPTFRTSSSFACA